MSHNNWRFLVNYCAVKRTGIAQIFERLPNRIRTQRAVDRVSRRMVRRVKAQFVINFGKRGVNNFRRHKISEDFFSPDVIKPIHRHEIAKPHMRRFMRNHRRAREYLSLGGGRI